MELNEFVESFERCCKKANVGYQITTDTDKIADFLADPETGKLYLEEHEIPYLLSDVESVKYYGSSTLDTDADIPGLRIRFRNGDALYLEDCEGSRNYYGSYTVGGHSGNWAPDTAELFSGYQKMFDEKKN